jgi:hypothetical protein
MRNSPRSFWKIADDYLKDEARHDFQSEGMLFAVISIAAALPLINNVHALIDFVRAITSH